MTSISDAPDPETQRQAEATDSRGRLLAADGTPLKVSLARAMRRQKLRAFALVAPLLLFILLTFIAPIADMLFRSVENDIVPDTLPRTVEALEGWDASTGDIPGPAVFEAAYMDLAEAVEAKVHTRLGSRLNYETSGMASMFRRSDAIYTDILRKIERDWRDEDTWIALFVDGDASASLPRAAAAYADWRDRVSARGENPNDDEPLDPAFKALYEDLVALEGDYAGPLPELVSETAAKVSENPLTIRDAFEAADNGWTEHATWETLSRFSGAYTSGYFLSAADLQYDSDGNIVEKPQDEQIYLFLFERTLWLSLTITFTCLLLGYPIAWLLANLPVRVSNLLLILVLLPFWTSLLVRTSSWIVLLQQQGVINDMLSAFYGSAVGRFLDPVVTSVGNVFVALANIIVQAVNIAIAALNMVLWLVWQLVSALGEIEAGVRGGADQTFLPTFGDAFDPVGYLGLIGYLDPGFERLQMMFNQTGTIIAMTHILLPFMILPLYSVMKTIPPTYVRAAKSLGATDFTAFWRVYFPNTVPGIGAGAILVFILSIGYYITPELVGGTEGIFISNRIAYHISSSLNWGLAAALATILLAVVLILYWVYDKIVGIDNVKLG